MGAIGPIRNEPNESTLPTRPSSSRGTLRWTAVSHNVPKPASEKPIPAAQTNPNGRTGSSPKVTDSGRAAAARTRSQSST